MLRTVSMNQVRQEVIISVQYATEFRQ